MCSGVIVDKILKINVTCRVLFVFDFCVFYILSPHFHIIIITKKLIQNQRFGLEKFRQKIIFYHTFKANIIFRNFYTAFFFFFLFRFVRLKFFLPGFLFFWVWFCSFPSKMLNSQSALNLK